MFIYAKNFPNNTFFCVCTFIKEVFEKKKNKKKTATTKTNLVKNKGGAIGFIQLRLTKEINF